MSVSASSALVLALAVGLGASSAHAGAADPPAWMPPQLVPEELPKQPTRLERILNWKARLDHKRGPYTSTLHDDGRVTWRNNTISAPSVALEPAIAASEFGPYDPEGARRDPMPGRRLVLSFGFNFDLGDMLMTAHGEDPYRVAKQRYLAATFEARALMGVAARRRWLLRALDDLPTDVARIWSDTTRSEAARRATLVTLWCEADSEVVGHTDVAAGEEARAIIETFLRHALPSVALPTESVCRSTIDRIKEDKP